MLYEVITGKRIRSVFASIDKGKITSAEVMAKLQSAIDELRTNGYDVDIKGEEEQNSKTQREMGQAASYNFV